MLDIFNSKSHVSNLFFTTILSSMCNLLLKWPNSWSKGTLNDGRQNKINLSNFGKLSAFMFDIISVNSFFASEKFEKLIQSIFKFQVFLFSQKLLNPIGFIGQHISISSSKRSLHLNKALKGSSWICWDVVLIIIFWIFNVRKKLQKFIMFIKRNF